MKKPDLETCTIQEACDYSVYKIVEQGGRCQSRVGNCSYSNEEGKHCSIGWLLDQDDYDLMTTNLSLYGMAQRKPEKLPKILKENLGLFLILQVFHDDFHMKGRKARKNDLSKFIDTTAPQYQRWVDMAQFDFTIKKSSTRYSV